MRFPGKGAPGGHLGPQNALDFIRFDKGLRNRAAKSTISIKLSFFMGEIIFYSRPRKLCITNVFNRYFRHLGSDMPPKTPNEPQNALNFIRFNRGLRHWAAKAPSRARAGQGLALPGPGRAGQGRALPGPALPGQGGAGPALPCPGRAAQGRPSPARAEQGRAEPGHLSRAALLGMLHPLDGMRL